MHGMCKGLYRERVDSVKQRVKHVHTSLNISSGSLTSAYKILKSVS